MHLIGVGYSVNSWRYLLIFVIPFNLSTTSGSGGGGSSGNGPQGVDLLHLSPAQEVNHVCSQVGILCLGVLNLDQLRIMCKSQTNFDDNSQGAYPIGYLLHIFSW